MLEGLCFAFGCSEGRVELQRAPPQPGPPPPLRVPACAGYPRSPGVQVYSLIAPVTDYLTVITVMDRSS